MKNPTPRWSLFRRYKVQAYGITYLSRLAIISTPWFGVWLHFIHRPDAGGKPHNHPWNFRTWVLHGGYVERIYPFPSISVARRNGIVREHKRWSFKKFHQDWAHQIESVLANTITLVIVGRHSDDWGFFGWKGFERWDESAIADGPSPFSIPGEYWGSPSTSGPSWWDSPIAGWAWSEAADLEQAYDGYLDNMPTEEEQYALDHDDTL